MVLFNIYRSVLKNTRCLSLSSCNLACGKNVRNALFIPVQNEPPKKTRKISVIGAAGQVGVAIMANLAWKSFCDDIVMIDPQRDRLCGEALDFLHGQPYNNTPRIYIGAEMKLTKDSDIIIVACGAPKKPGQSRTDIAKTNIELFKQIIPCLAEFSPECIFIIVTNPVDIMAYATWKYSCFDKNRIIGTGTEIDVARLRYYCSKRLGINPYCVENNVILAHGDCSIPVWSTAHVAGTTLRDVDKYVGCCVDPNRWNDLHDDVKEAEDLLSKWKGGNAWSIGIIVSEMAQAILQDSKTIHHVSLSAKGLYDIETDCFMSFPAVLGNRGIRDIVQQVYDEEEMIMMRNYLCKINQEFETIKF